MITRLAKLRSLFVIAQGTVFALHERGIGPEEAGRMLNVDYVVSGSLRRQRQPAHRDGRARRDAHAPASSGPRCSTSKLDDAFLVLDEIGNRIVASIASEIETVERNRAILKPPNSLDAWEAHHRGLWHMYRFNKADNERARQFFEKAVRLDPTFARAYAGLSFTHFQNAFQGWAKREPEIERAFEAAGQSLMVDDRDPGRALGHGPGALAARPPGPVDHRAGAGGRPQPEFRARPLHAGLRALAGRRSARRHHVLRSFAPLEPVRSRCCSPCSARAPWRLVRLGRFDEAAEWAVKAAARPNAHAHILAIAAYCLALAGRRDEARTLLASIHKTLPDYRVDDFLAAFRFEPDAVALFRKAAKRIGMD